MNDGLSRSQSTGIWRQLFCDGAAIGIFLGLLEVCWVCLLPTIFPGRKYVLPISFFGQFVLLAVVVDAFLVLTGVTILGALLSVVRKLFVRSRTFAHWPVLIRFVLLSGGLMYFFIAIVYTYYFFNSTNLKQLTATVGVLLIILLSGAIAWLLKILRDRLGKTAPIVAWVIMLIVLICVITPNYLHYRSATGIVGGIDLPTEKPSRPSNILFVTLDTLRADHLGCYGNKIVQTPTLDALAADGCLFEAAFAQAATTTPSHCSMMVSAQVARHGAMNGSAMKTGYPTLSEVLQNVGYETAAFVSSTMVRSSNSGLQRGFDYYEDSISPYTSLLKNDASQFLLATALFAWLQDNQIPGSVVSRRAMGWLGRREQGPFFCLLHYFDPHDPYDAPEPYKEMYAGKIDPDLPCSFQRMRYAGDVTYTDFELGRVIQKLKDEGLYEKMLIIVTSDHGEAFGERHGEITEHRHGQYLYDTTQHVPLIIKMPAGKGAGRRIPDVVQLIDLAPTVLDYLGVSAPESFEGKSLLDLLNGQERKEPGVAYSENKGGGTILPGIGVMTNMRIQISMRTPEAKYIYDLTKDKEELYEIATDPGETINVFSEKSELAESCYRRLQNVLKEAVETEVIEVDPRILKQLKSLGYVDDH